MPERDPNRTLRPRDPNAPKPDLGDGILAEGSDTAKPDADRSGARRERGRRSDG